jgi:hypothetical protein
MYVTPTSIGLGTSNPEKSLSLIGDVEFNPVIVRYQTWGTTDFRIDIDDLKGSVNIKKITSWGPASNVGDPTYICSGGYYDGNFVRCAQGSNYFTVPSQVTLNSYTNAGFTAVAMVRFTKDARSNECIFSFSNNNNYIEFARHSNTSQLKFATDEISATPLITPSNTIRQNEWALFSILYDGISNELSIYKNIEYNIVDLIITHTPIATVSLSSYISDKTFNALTNMSIGNANLDISHLYILDRLLNSYELVDIQRNIIYNANASFKIATDTQPYPPYEFYSDATGWLKEGTRNGGQVYKKTYDHMAYGNGTYRVWATSESTTGKSHMLLNTNADDEWSTSTNTYVATADALPTPTLYIELPNQIQIQSYTITASYTTPLSTPSKWILSGSSDNTTWFAIDIIDGEIDWTQGEQRIYHVNTITPCKYVRLELLRNTSFPVDYIKIETFQLNGKEINMQLDGTGLGLNTSYLKERLTVEGNASISSCNIVGRQIQTENKANVMPFPSTSIGSNTASVGGEMYGNGLYVVTASSSNTGNNPYMAFDNSFSTRWSSAQNKYASTGAYSGATSTTISSTPRTGEWLQLQLPQAMRLNSYRITPDPTTSQLSAPSTFYIAGSVNGTTWDLLDSQVKTWPSTAGPSNFMVSQFSNLTPYNYFRIVTNKIGIGATATTTASIIDWKLYGEVYNNPIGNEGNSITYGDTFTSDHTFIATNTLHDRSVKFSLNATQLKAKIVTGGLVNTWNNVSQNDTSLQPLYFKEGGHKNLAYVRFAASNTMGTSGTFLSGGSGEMLINGNDGLTMVVLARFVDPIFTDENLVTFSSNATLGNVINFSRYGGTQQLTFTIYNATASASNSVQSGSIISQNEWAVFAARYTNSTKKMEIFKNNVLSAFTYGTLDIPNNYFASSRIGGANIDVASLYVWESKLSDNDLSEITDILMQGYPQLYVQGAARISKSIEGTLNVRSANTFTNSVMRYPPVDLISNNASILNQTYGNGSYRIAVSKYYQNNDLYNGYNAFQSLSTTGWFGEQNAYNTSTGLYVGNATTTVSSTTYLGDWIQIEMPDPVLVWYYTINPRTDFATTSPMTWYFLGSTNGIEWSIIDTQTNYNFTSTTEITFDVSSNGTAYRYYRLVITKKTTGGGTVGMLRISLYAKSRDTIMCQDDKVIVFDKLGVGLSNPASSLHVAGFSVLSGLKIIPGNYSNVVVPLNPGGTGSGGSGGGSGGNPVGYNPEATGTAFGISGTTSAYSFRYVVGSSSNEVARLNGVGYLGLGTTNPSEMLHVNNTGNVKVGSNLYVLNRLSIGKSNPQAGLDVNAISIFSSNVSVTDTGYISIGSGASNNTKFAITTDPIRTNGLDWGDWAAEIATNSVTTRISQASGKGMVIDTGSAFAVTQTPYSTNYPTSAILELKNTETGTILFARNDGKIGIGYSNVSETLSIAGNMSLSNRGKVILSTSNNRLGINVALPNYSLDVLGDVNFTGNMYNNGNAFPISRWQNWGDITYYMSNIGIGMSNATEMFAVYSNMSLSNDNGKVVFSTSNGALGLNISKPLEALSIGSNFSLSNLTGKVVISTLGSFFGVNAPPTSSLSILGTMSMSNWGVTNMYASNTMLGLNVPVPTASLSIPGTLSMSNFGNVQLTSSNNNLGINVSAPTESLSIGGTLSLSNWGKVTLTSSNNFLGIGKTNPGFTLDILGDVNVSGNLYAGGANLVQWVTTGSNVYYNTGYVGIGTTSMPSLLTVAGNITARHVLPDSTNTYNIGANTSNYKSIYLNDSVNISDIVISKSGSNIRFSDSTLALKNIIVNQIQLGASDDPDDNHVFLIRKTASGFQFLDATSGINTATPVTLIQYLYQNNSNLGFGVTNPTESIAGLNSLSLSNFGKVTVYSSNSYLGIEKQTPAYLLDVNGHINTSSNYKYNGSNVGLWMTATGGSNIYYTLSNGLVGIGKSNLTFSLDVAGSINADGAFYQNGVALGTWGSYNGTVYMTQSNVGIGVSNAPETFAVAGNMSLSNLGKVVLTTSNNNLGINFPLPSETLSIGGNITLCNAGGIVIIGSSNSNVGIGTSEPGQKLTVLGDFGLSNATNITIFTPVGSNIGLNVVAPDASFAINGNLALSNYGEIIIHSSNNCLGIGTPQPSQVLTVLGNIGLSNATGTAVIASSGSNIGIGVSSPFEGLAVNGNFSLSNYGKVVCYTSNGYFGISKANPNATLQVGGNLLAGYSHIGQNSLPVGGPFFTQQPWDVAAATHTIAYSNYCFGENSMGTIHIQVSNKSAAASNAKCGNMQVSFFKSLGASNVDLFTIFQHKTTTLTLMSVTYSSNDIVVSTDSDCSIAWTSIGSF